ncbi:unnamed protein product [Caenorhabditis brenneri]
MLESPRFLGEISELRIRNFDGEVTPHMLPMFEKCPPNTVEKIQIFYKSRGLFPINKFLKYPMVALPCLPLLQLDDTVRKNLLSMKPILSDEEHQELESLSERFRKGVGRRLQRYLTLKSWFL